MGDRIFKQSIGPVGRRWLSVLILFSSSMLLVATAACVQQPVAKNADDSSDSTSGSKKQETQESAVTVETFQGLISRNPLLIGNSIKKIGDNWHPGSPTLLIEAARMSRSRDVLDQAIWLIESKTGETLGRDIKSLLQWSWNRDVEPHPLLAEFKSVIYSGIDPRFSEYFEAVGNAKIRLDEVVWGGVKRDGIPPLKDPEMVPASDSRASYLSDTEVVFGVTLNGESRCYPKRILAWHEMFKDTIGGESVCGVY